MVATVPGVVTIIPFDRLKVLGGVRILRAMSEEVEHYATSPGRWSPIGV
jgi:hypothetical protein